MSVGRTISKQEIDARLGDWAVNIQRHLNETAMLKSVLDPLSEDDLVALGYTPNEAAIAKSAVADGAQADLVFTGNAVQTEAKDSREFIKQCWGVGAF